MNVAIRGSVFRFIRIPHSHTAQTHLYVLFRRYEAIMLRL